MNLKNTCFHSLFLAIFVQCFMVRLAMSVRNLTTDQLSLVEFKNRVVDPHNVLANNWTDSTSVCNWLGVSCGVKHERVTSLNLPNMSLTGTIPPQLGNLSFLVYLDLGSNNFHGYLPEEMGKLRRLRVIELSFNSLHGGIPSWLGKLHKVEELRMENNSFTGTVPQTLANMFNLEILNLGFNQLSGQIPSSFFNISSLKQIGLYGNSLSGSLPDDMCVHLPKLEVLWLHTNELSGYIRSSISKCSNLQNLALDTNHFHGLIPRNIGNLTRLKEVYLNLNNLEGEIPEEIGNLVSLEVINFGYNRFTAQIPASLFNISSLKFVSLRNISLSGSLPDDMCQHLPKLEYLLLDLNEISGNIPSSIGKCSNLKNLSLSTNQLTGHIPKSIGNLTNLQNLFLADNKLEGNLPPLTGAGKLEQLVLSRNNLSGNFPHFISNASMLKVFSIEENSFSGFIPNTLGSLRHLEWFHIYDNHLTTDPEWSFLTSLANCRNLGFLIVSRNPLKGILPTSIGNLSKSLQAFAAQRCELEGNIPVEIGNLSSVLRLYLDNNKISGSIPATISRLGSIQGLFLAGNKLKGSIPEEICALDRLYALYLSFNKLQGPILPCLGNLTSLGRLYLNSNKLSFAIPSTLWSLKDMLAIDLSSNYLNSTQPFDVGDMRALVYLNLSRNLLASDISSTIGGLQGLKYLDLSYNRLHGHIPESFGGMVSLEVLDLCKNNLSGVIPKSMEKLLYLTDFNVSFNRLEGEIPTGGHFSNFSSTSFMRNYALCGPPRLLVPPCKSTIHGVHSRMTKVMSFLKYGLPAIASFIVIVVLIVAYRKSRARDTSKPKNDDLWSVEMRRRISRGELLRATDGFDSGNLLGSGSFGSVYKGRLLDGTNVAIKVFNLQLEGAFKSFDVECEAMTNLVHRNLVKVITCCSNLDFKALVLDFMPNGSLEQWLHSGDYFLDMLQRIDIMVDVASALEYLHAGLPTPIIHCDLKPSNILLDEDMVAHVGDFGIAKLLGEGDFVTQTMTLATIGYMAPEYGLAGLVSVKCDVYSYGILLMETFTKKKPTDEMFTEELNMQDWVKKSLGKGMIDIVDANLLTNEDEYFIVKANCISSILELALDCSAELPEERKDMKDVVVKLKKIKQNFLNTIDQAGQHVQFGVLK